MDTSSALVLHSGGLDSTTALFWAKKFFSKIIALNIVYSQKHSVEVFVSRKLCDEFGIERIEFDISCLSFLFSSSSLVGNKQILEKEYPVSGIISTYVPMRNTLFGVIAAIVCEIRDVKNIVLGIHASDSPNYPDTRPEWASSLEAVINTGSRFGFEKKRLIVHTPLINLSKKEIVVLAKDLGVPFDLTWSCYSPVYLGNIVKPCMDCPSCNARKKAFEQAHIEDTLGYVEI
ncbi:MAG: 7-cyano-7-deazaguanine synthase QueC [Brevinematia bacterium]